jgi:prepilin-type N-terminal cleavage/methylation domain-containing protein
MRPLTSGFSLIENLVALTVLSIGLLGTAALLASALGALRIGAQRQTAIVLSDDMASRLLGSDVSADHSRLADFQSWRDEVASRLPGGNGSVTRAPGGRVDVFTIDVSWNEPSLGTLHHVVDVAVSP